RVSVLPAASSFRSIKTRLSESAGRGSSASTVRTRLAGGQHRELRSSPPGAGARVRSGRGSGRKNAGYEVPVQQQSCLRLVIVPMRMHVPVLELLLGGIANIHDFHIKMQRLARHRVVRINGDFVA